MCWLLSCIDRIRVSGHYVLLHRMLALLQSITIATICQHSYLQATGVLTAVMHWAEPYSKPLFIAAQHDCIAANCYSNIDCWFSCLQRTGVLLATYKCTACCQALITLYSIEAKQYCTPDCNSNNYSRPSNSSPQAEGILTAVQYWPEMTPWPWWLMHSMHEMLHTAYNHIRPLKSCLQATGL